MTYPRFQGESGKAKQMDQSDSVPGSQLSKLRIRFLASSPKAAQQSYGRATRHTRVLWVEWRWQSWIENVRGQALMSMTTRIIYGPPLRKVAGGLPRERHYV